jgi:predicted metal-dependent hydrolase
VTTAIRPRRVRFDWADTPVHWIPGDPQTTHTINVLHLLLPAGEKWFVDVYRQALPLITDEQLREDVKGFMGQEAVHSRAHAVVLDHLADQGIDASPYTRRIEWMFGHVLGDRPFGRRAPSWFRPFWLRQRLAVIAAIEHFTAVMGMWVIDSPGLDRAGADPVMLDLLRWHGAEEVEHRSVAFDLYQHLSGSYVRRLQTMLGAVTMMTYLWIQGTRFLIHADPTHPPKATWRHLWRSTRTGRMPEVKDLALAVPRYLRPAFHPSREGSTEAALAYLSTSPAAMAAAS